MLSLVAIAIACAVTVVISLDYPVHSDDFYFEKYQEVDENFIEIQHSQENFEKKFSVEFLNSVVKVGAPVEFRLKITPKSGEEISNLSLQGLLTRKFTNEFDAPLTAALDGSEFKSNSVTLQEKGIWEVKFKISDEANNTAFYTFETNATI